MEKRKPVATQKQVRLPAPLGGLNTAVSVLETPPTDALILDNFIIRPFGIEVRKGYKRQYNAAFPDAVKTVMPYMGRDPSQNKLFCSTAAAFGPVYDVTTPGASPPGAASVTPANAPDNAGEWYYTMFNTTGGNFLCCVQQGSGYWTYDAAGGWINRVPTFPDSTTPQDISFIFAWKRRIWFLKRNSAQAYYLPIDALTGATAMFDFGPVLQRGGYLHALASWTYDGGSGMDDALVIVSSQGDMLVYKGTDPASVTTFELKGRWYVGRMPSGRRNISQQGGDVYIITEYGIVSVSDFVSGKITAPSSQSTAAGKYNLSLAQYVSKYLTAEFWFLCPVPSENILLVGAPFLNPYLNIYQCFVQSQPSGGWSTITGIEPLCGDMYNGNFIYGTRDGYLNVGFYKFLDGDTYDEAGDGSEVTGRFLSGFFDYGSPTKNKRATRVRLLGLSDGVPAWAVKLKNEYDLSEFPSVTSPLSSLPSFWDVALWDLGAWLITSITFKKWVGVASFGKKLATQVAIRGSGYTLVTDYEVTFTEGLGF